MTLPAEPVALTKLASSTDELAPLAKIVANKVNWTGKPAPPPPPAVTPLTAEEQKRFEAGKVVFLGLCAGCHNDNGEGKEKLGANLVRFRFGSSRKARKVPSGSCLRSPACFRTNRSRRR